MKGSESEYLPWRYIIHGFRGLKRGCDSTANQLPVIASAISFFAAMLISYERQQSNQKIDSIF